jgi:hypothetical protein
MRMRVPDLRGIEAFPGGPDQFVLGEAARQVREAGIPYSLLGPQAVGRESGRSKRRAAG